VTRVFLGAVTSFITRLKVCSVVHKDGIVEDLHAVVCSVGALHRETAYVKQTTQRNHGDNSFLGNDSV
jgi:hypothetical protein